MDRFSPVAPASIRALVLPVGHIERARFLAFVRRLQTEASVVRLADLEQHPGDDAPLLSPKPSSPGSLLYNYAASLPGEVQRQLPPFELFREPLLVVGVVDGRSTDDDGSREELERATHYLRERHPRVVHRQLLVLGDAQAESGRAGGHTTHVAHADQPNHPSLKAAIRNVSARFLVELSTYARAMQASPSVQTPGQTARSLQRKASVQEQERRSGSGHATPTNTTEPSTPVDEAGPKPSPFSSSSPPPISIDRIASTGSVPSAVPRPDSQPANQNVKHGHSSSQDRVPVQGFGSVSQEKSKNRGKARVGIVVGSIYMMAGQWSEAMRVLVEHTSKARSMSDHIWHAKGLECLVVCMLMHSWAKLEFQMPSICYPISERPLQGHVPRFSVTLQASDYSSAEAAQKASVRRLSTSLPELLKLILSLYRSGEGSLELPFLAVSEATIRFCKILVALRGANGEMNSDAMAQILPSLNRSDKEAKSSIVAGHNGPSRGAIVDMLSHAQPTNEDGVPAEDHISLLAGMASVYALLHMNRKKAITMRDMVVRLTVAFTQARKRSAAEMGIHPAASLSADGSVDVATTIAEESLGIHHMISEIAQIYGIPLQEPSTKDAGLPGPSFFGGDSLQMMILRDMAAFYEACPDPHGTLRLTTAMLRAAGPQGAVDGGALVSKLPRDEQIRLATTIIRTVGVSRHLGLSDVQATFWDLFLVRGIKVAPSSLERAVLDRSKLKTGVVPADEAIPINPLLYDPNASRPGTNTQEPTQIPVLVHDESFDCIVSLQNPYEISLDIESLELVTEGVELRTRHGPTMTLHPMRIQQLLLSVSPSSAGECKITGCRIKIHGCADQVFPIVSRPWRPSAPTLIKDMGQNARVPAEDTRPGQKLPGPAYATVLASVVPPQPVLTVDDSSIFESNLMLLDGERRECTVVLRNTSNVEAVIFDVVTTNDALRLDSGSNDCSSDFSKLKQPVLVPPDDTAALTFTIIGKPGLSNVQAAFYYASSVEDSTHARMLSISIDFTVNVALKLQHLDILPLDEKRVNSFNEEAFILAFDVGNAWPKTISYDCDIPVQPTAPNQTPTSLTKEQGMLAPGEIRRVHLRVLRSSISAPANGDADAARTALLKKLRVRWTTETRAGEVDVSGLSLRPESLALIRGQPVRIHLSLLDLDDSPTIRAGTFITLRVTLTNLASSATGPLFVHVQARSPSPFDADVADERRLVIAGAARRVLPPLPSEGGDTTVDFALCPLLSGTVELVAAARPAVVSEVAKGEAPEWTVHGRLRLRVV